MKCLCKNRSHWKNISKEKIRTHFFVVYVLVYPLSKFGSNRTNPLRLLDLYSVCFNWKHRFKKTASNVSIRQVIFTSGQNLKPPFLCQYLIFSMIYFYIIDFIWIITFTEKSKFEENCRSGGIWKPEMQCMLFKFWIPEFVPPSTYSS